jgi:hypothetical protein
VPILLCASIAVLLPSVVAPRAASAAELTAPDSQGAYAICNLRMNRWTNWSPYNPGSPWEFWVSCAYSQLHAVAGKNVHSLLLGLAPPGGRQASTPADLR